MPERFTFVRDTLDVLLRFAELIGIVNETRRDQSPDEMTMQDRPRIIAVARSENLVRDGTRAILLLVKHIPPTFRVFAMVFYFDTTSQLRGTRIGTLFSCTSSCRTVNCMRERRSFSALAASGSLLRRRFTTLSFPAAGISWA